MTTIAVTEDDHRQTPPPPPPRPGSPRVASPRAPPPLSAEMGRPDLPKIFQSFFPSDTEVFKRAGVVACAPLGLVHDCQREAAARNVAIHIEEFGW